MTARPAQADIPKMEIEGGARPLCDAVMIVGFGGPSSAGEIRPFLDRVLQGRPVSRERYEEVVHHYESLGGRSPYNELTFRQAAALRAKLEAAGIGAPIVVGMRNTPPFIEASLRDLAARGARRVFGFILAAHRCEASWERYQRDVAEARARIGASPPEVVYPSSWHDDPRFIAAVADRARAALDRLDATVRDEAELIFTAHSIPARMAAESPYVTQLQRSAELVAGALGRSRWRIAYQSRSGGPREPWLEPEVNEALRSTRARAAVAVPIGFLCDHVEVLYDLDIEAAGTARSAGVAFERAATVSDHPQFIELIAALARAHLIAGTKA